MNALEEATIEEEITLINNEISHQRRLIESREYESRVKNQRFIHPKLIQQISSIKAKIKCLEKKQKNLQSLLDEQEAGWEIVFTHIPNDYDEVWKHASPGPDLTKALPESHKLDLVIYDNQANSVSGIRFLLYQLQTTLTRCQEVKVIKEGTLV